MVDGRLKAKAALVFAELAQMGIDLDIEREISYLREEPKLLRMIIAALDQELKYKRSFRKRPLPEGKEVKMLLRRTYNKHYYSAAKLSERAKRIYFEYQSPDEYTVVFRGSQVEEIWLMTFAIITPFNQQRDDIVSAKEYLRENFYLCHLENTLWNVFSVAREDYEYNFLMGSAIGNVIKGIWKIAKEKLNDLYAEMVAENRVPTKWAHEYQLYSYVKSYIKDAVYQYKCEFLGSQAFDIYIPSQMTAIEYQGIQHFEPVDFFGGYKGLLACQERDFIKKIKAEENGINLLYWTHENKITMQTVRAFLQENGIRTNGIENAVVDLTSSDIAPTIRT